jgi:hypothetical protein
VCDEYGPDAAARREVLDLVGASFDLAAGFVRRRVEAGDAAFVERLDRLGGSTARRAPTPLVAEPA